MMYVAQGFGMVVGVVVFLWNLERACPVRKEWEGVGKHTTRV